MIVIKKGHYIALFIFLRFTFLWQQWWLRLGCANYGFVPWDPLHWRINWITISDWLLNTRLSNKNWSGSYHICVQQVLVWQIRKTTLKAILYSKYWVLCWEVLVDGLLQLNGICWLLSLLGLLWLKLTLSTEQIPLHYILEESNFDFRYVRLCDLDISREKWLNHLQIVETLKRWCFLQHLSWVCTVCQLPFCGFPDQLKQYLV